MTGSNRKPKTTIRAGRRRPSGPTQPGERPRAEAPRRRRPGEESPSTPSFDSIGGGQLPPTASGGGLPGGPGRQMNPRMMLIVLGIIIIMAIFGIPLGLQQEGDQTSFEYPTEPVEVVQSQEEQTRVPTATKRPTSTPRPATGESLDKGDSWLVMLYQDADDKILEQDIYIDLNEAERIGSTDQVQIVAQVDRFQAGFQGDGNWSSTRRYYVTQDDDLNTVNSELVANLGEINMSDGAALIDFVPWAVENYPADRHILILSDHGMGWPGGWSDSDSKTGGDRNIPLSKALGDQLYLMELD